MMEEYIRLTKIAFGTTHDTPPVFLLDEIQKLCRPTNVESSFKQDGTSQMHSQLSLLLTQLAASSSLFVFAQEPIVERLYQSQKSLQSYLKYYL
jgi:hypothetical protein